MKLYIFKSEANTALRAFAADEVGRNLPDQFQPWLAVGIVASEKAPPHNLSRDEIENAIKSHGFQLWRMKPKAVVAPTRYSNVRRGNRLRSRV